jgi:hypothetical protein
MVLPVLKMLTKYLMMIFLVVRHRSYMKDMAAVYKNEENFRYVYDLKKPI